MASGVGTCHGRARPRRRRGPYSPRLRALSAAFRSLRGHATEQCSAWTASGVQTPISGVQRSRSGIALLLTPPLVRPALFGDEAITRAGDAARLLRSDRNRRRRHVRSPRGPSAAPCERGNPHCDQTGYRCLNRLSAFKPHHRSELRHVRVNRMPHSGRGWGFRSSMYFERECRATVRSCITSSG